jgi:hypothetical protein
MSQKECRDCGLVKEAAEFWKRKASADGLALYCKECFGLRNAAATRRRMAKRGQTVGPYRKRESFPEGMKRCPRCQEIKGLERFVRNRAKSSGFSPYCKSCWPAVVHENKRRNHGSTRNYLLKLRYRLTAEDVDTQLRHQNGVCVICLRRPANHVDHDHMTGLFRAVLCFSCNGGLGQFDDDPGRMRESADYLEGRSSHSRTMMLEMDALTIERDPSRRAKRRAHRGTARDYHLQERYGLQEADVRDLLRMQRDHCAICGDRPAKHIDHDHATGAVRGVLCGGCNTGMGQLGDDPVALRRAADYVQRKLIRQVPLEDGGVRLSFTWPDVDPASVPLDGWEPYRAEDGEQRRVFLYFEERAFDRPHLEIMPAVPPVEQKACHRRPLRAGVRSLGLVAAVKRVAAEL